MVRAASSAAPDSVCMAEGRIHTNAAWNLLGLAAPLLLALFAVPKLIAALGAGAFGLLTLFWSLIGYFSLLDLGLGRALAQVTAANRASGREQAIPPAFWTSLLLMTLLGLLGAAVSLPFAGWFSALIVNGQPSLQADARACLYLVALSAPVLTVSAALRGFLEAHQRFAPLSAVRIGLGALTFVVPVLLLPYSHRVAAMVASLVLARVLALAVYGWLCFSLMPSLWGARTVDWTAARALLRLGTWMTVSNVISPLMTYLDRFLIAAILSVSAVAFYATPFEAATKLLIIPGALTGVLFPAFSGALVSDRQSATRLYRRSLLVLASVFLPLSLALAAFARPALALWLGPDFAANTRHVLPILALGIFANGVAGVPFSLIQAAGRPDLTARLHVAEAPLYFAACWLLTKHYGIDGAALAWTGRVLVDAIALLLIARIWATREHADAAPSVPALARWRDGVST
ncbi:MAG: flippase [Bryobacterales bacterium]|nr:flippase [Bryobacterales bacterium]